MAYDDDRPKGPNKVRLTAEQLASVERGNFTEQQVAMIYEDMGSPGLQNLQKFMYICVQRGLNPLLNEVHAEFRWNKAIGDFKMAIITHIDAYRKIADLTGNYDGQSTEWIESEGGGLLGAKSIIYRRDCAHPFESECFLNEYSTGFGNWKSMPRVMISKVSEASCFRKAFPAALSGLYISEEMQKTAREESEDPRGTTEAAVAVGKAKVAALGGDPDKVEAPPKKTTRGKAKAESSTVDAAWKASQEFADYKKWCAEFKAKMKHHSGSDFAYYEVLKQAGEYKHCTDATDKVAAKRVVDMIIAAHKILKSAAIARTEAIEIRKRIGDARYGHVLEQIEACACHQCGGSGIDASNRDLQDIADIASAPQCGLCNGQGFTIEYVAGDDLHRVLEALRAEDQKPQESGITDEDVPTVIGKPWPEHHKALMKCQESIIASHRRGDKFMDVLGSHGFERIEDVPDMKRAKAVIEAIEGWVSLNPPAQVKFEAKR